MNVERYEKALWKAVRTLEEIRTDPSVYRDREEDRIRGKIEGVKLALSYLRDEQREDCEQRRAQDALDRDIVERNL